MTAHKTDKKFPGLTADDFCRRIAEALRNDTAGFSSPEKRIAQVAGVHFKTARFWLEAKFAPQSYHMARLVAEFTNVRGVWNEITGQTEDEYRQRLDQIKALLKERA